MGYQFLFLIVLIAKFINIEKENNIKLQFYPFWNCHFFSNHSISMDAKGP